MLLKEINEKLSLLGWKAYLAPDTNNRNKICLFLHDIKQGRVVAWVPR